MLRIRLPWLFAWLALAALLLAACAGDQEDAQGAAADGTDGAEGDGDAAELTPVSLRLNWRMKGEFAPILVAEEKGYFEAEGLDVGVLEGQGATQTLQVVCQATMTSATSPRSSSSSR